MPAYKAIHHNYSRDTPRNIKATVDEWIFPKGPKEKRGETFGIIGRNGSGKSTLLQMVAGTLPPTAQLEAVFSKIGYSPETPIVVYDDGGGAAIRSWLLLRRLGHRDVRILRGGALGWVDHVLNPVLPAGTAEERARFDRVARVSRYFGGLPKVGEPKPLDADPARTEEAISLISRRGCY